MKNNSPEQIYLQAHDAEGHLLDATQNEVTWCVDRINENDTVYILATLELAELLERLASYTYSGFETGSWPDYPDDVYTKDEKVARKLAASIREALGQDMLSQAQETEDET